MWEYIKRIIAGFTGLIGYPLVSLFANLLVSIVFIGGSWGFGLYLLIKNLIDAFSERDYPMILLFSLMLLASVVLFLPVLTVAVVCATIIITLYDLFRTMTIGLILGFQGGFPALREELDEISNCSTFVRGIDAFLNYFPSEQNLVEVVEQPIVQEDQEAPYIYLNDNQIALVENYLYQIHLQNEQAKSKTFTEVVELIQQKDDIKNQLLKPLSPDELNEAETKKEILGSLFKSYQDLNNRLNQLDGAIASRSDSSDDLKDLFCKLTHLPIVQPALLVKQYLNDKNEWKVIPNQTEIVDKDSILEWVLKNNTHPTTREPLDTPNKVTLNNVIKETRYRLIDYTNKNDAAELIEITESIREKLKPINLVLSSARNLAQRFFDHGEQEAKNQENPDENLNNVI